MLKHMKAHKHLKPGENGTLRLVERFGDTLLCVRYRYDVIRDMRIKTAEIIVDEKPGKGVPRIRETGTGSLHNESTARSSEGGRRKVGPGAKALAGAMGFDTGGQGVGGKGCAGMKRRIIGSSLYKEYRKFLIQGIISSYR